MQCPKCHFESEAQTIECLRCGVIFARYAPETHPSETASVPAERPAGEREGIRRELIYRIFALPGALIIARLFVGFTPLVRLLTMWVHECGHAITAWLGGFGAMPGPWFTPVASERSFVVTALLGLALGFAGFQAWQRQRWTLVMAVAVCFVLQVVLTRMYSDQAQAAIIFGGDGGCFVLGAVLMLTFYASHESAIYQNSLRWGFLAIGAASFMDAYVTWTGGIDKIPFGENENGMSDPSVLTELYNWPLPLLIQRYGRLAGLCLAVLAVAYGLGLLQSFLALKPED